MDRYLVVSGIAVLLICVGLSGCTQNGDVTGDTDKVELTDNGVKTSWWRSSSGTTERDGFYHDIPSGTYTHRYVITGSVKNIAGKPMDNCRITAKISDGEGNVLGTFSRNVVDLYMDESKDFTITINSYDLDYFEHAEEYTLSVSVTLH